MGGYTFMISCPKGKEYHQQLKDTFPNLSAKIMELLAVEMKKAKQETESNAVRDKWMLITPYPALKRLIGNNDPFNYETNKVIEMLRNAEITVTEKEAAQLINKLQNEWLDKHGEY